MNAYRVEGPAAGTLLAIAERQQITVAHLLARWLPDVAGPADGRVRPSTDPEAGAGVLLVEVSPVVLEVRTVGSRIEVDSAVAEALREFGQYQYLAPGAWLTLEYHAPAAAEAAAETLSDLAAWAPWAGLAATAVLVLVVAAGGLTFISADVS